MQIVVCPAQSTSCKTLVWVVMRYYPCAALCCKAVVYVVAGIGHCLLSYSSTLRGISKLQLDANRLHADLDKSWEVLAEPIQTVMRRYAVPEPYEKLKAFTRGQQVTQQSMQQFVQEIDGLPQPAKEALQWLTPMTYVGNAEQQAKSLQHHLKDSC